MKVFIALLLVISGCACAGLPGAAAADGESGSATACSATSKKVIGGRFPVNLAFQNVDPTEAELATCTQARKVAERVTAIHLSAPAAVQRFSCSDFVLKRKPGIYRYRCTYDGAETTTEITITFAVSYVSEAVRAS